MSTMLDPWVENPAKMILPRAGFMFVARTGVTRERLAASFRSARARVLEQMPTGGSVQIAVRHSDDPLGSGVDDWDAMASPDAVMVLSWQPGDTDVDFAAPARGLAQHLDDVLDLARSVAVAGMCHLLETGWGPVLMAGGARRVEGTTLQELSDWWLHHHGPLCMTILEPRPLGYQQLHPDPEQSRVVAEAAGIATTRLDMFVCAYFDSLDDFTGSLARPGIAERLRRDEEGHYDHATMFGSMFEVLD